MPGTRRQARGLARIEQILDVAAGEIAEKGLDGATMNGIARRAGISPGSLYQFFSDKQQLATALADRFRQLFEESLPMDPPAELVRAAPLTALIDGVVDPVIAYSVNNPGFHALFVRMHEPGEIADAFGSIYDTLDGRLVAVIRLRVPGIDPADALRVAQMSNAVFMGVMPKIVGSEEPERSRVIRELKTMLLRYLEPYDAA